MDIKNNLPLDREILLSVPQAASLMHTQPARVRVLLKNGYLKALKLGELKIRRAEIDRFLEEAEGKDFSEGEVRSLKL